MSIAEKESNPTVFRQNLQKAFYEQYFHWLANTLADIDAEDRRPGYLNESICDVNMTEDDYCTGDSLLHYQLPDHLLDGEVSHRQVLGYEASEETAWTDDYQACLNAVAIKLGMTQASPTEEQVFDVMEVMPSKELKQRFMKSNALSAPTPQPPIIKKMMKKAIKTVYKPS